MTDLAETLRRRSEAMKREAREADEHGDVVTAAEARGASAAFLWAARMADHADKETRRD